MNRSPSPLPSPPVGERVSEGRVRGIAIGSKSQCMREYGRRISTNLMDDSFFDGGQKFRNNSRTSLPRLLLS